MKRVIVRVIVRKPEFLLGFRILPAAGEIVRSRKYCSNQAMLIKRDGIVNQKQYVGVRNSAAFSG
jgi:hypothetical protein